MYILYLTFHSIHQSCFFPYLSYQINTASVASAPTQHCSHNIEDRRHKPFHTQFWLIGESVLSVLSVLRIATQSIVSSLNQSIVVFPISAIPLDRRPPRQHSTDRSTTKISTFLFCFWLIGESVLSFVSVLQFS
jgi:hypothetical protein